MLPGNDKANDQQQNEKPDAENSQAASPAPRDEKVEEALKQAEHDIDLDPEFSANSPNDDLDEGETARLGEDMGGII